MSRLPGKKLRTETAKLSGGIVADFELRLLEDGKFYANIGGVGYRAPSLEELRAEVIPVLQQMHVLEWVPVISIEHAGERSDSYWRHGRQIRKEEVELGITAGWATTTPVRDDLYGWNPTSVTKDGAAVEQPDDHDRRRPDVVTKRDREALVPFTPDRWRTLVRIQDAIAETRRKLGQVLDDASGARLDAMPADAILLAAPSPPLAQKRRR